MFRHRSRESRGGTVDAHLQYWSQKLHDLSGRNRLLYYRETGASSATIEHPAFMELFRTLVERGQALTAPVPRMAIAADPVQPAGSALGADVPDLEELLPEQIIASDAPALEDGGEDAAEPVGARHGPASPARAREVAPKPREILTNHSVPQLNRVLYNLRYAARTIHEEQGLHVLYVTFGMLRWRENHSAAFSRAPLVLVPISVERNRLNSPYTIRIADEDIVVNPVLQVKLMKDFGLRLPEVGNDLSGRQLRSFLEETRGLLVELEGWEIEEKATLGAFSFLTLLLIKDFENHAALYARHPLVRWLSGGEGPGDPVPPPAPTADELDEAVDPATVFQILDADSSQQEAIEAAKRGLSFILQGPPGTGKSQTIANLIAESLMAGKRVLFVSQKLAALEVVRSRLARKGLDEFCLEIHSHRMDKRRVVRDLMDSLARDSIRLLNPMHTAKQKEIGDIRQELNSYVRQLHEPRPALGLSLYELQGRLSHCLDAPPLTFSVPKIEEVTAEKLAQMLAAIRELTAYSGLLQDNATSRWKGFAGTATSLEERERLRESLLATGKAVSALEAQVSALLASYGLPAPESLQDVLDFAHVLTCFRAEALSAQFDGVILRYRGRGLSGGRFLSVQYGGDADKLAALLRPDRQPTIRDVSSAVATLARSIRKGRDRRVGETEGAELPEPNITDLERRLVTIEGGYAEARRLFGEAEAPAVLQDLYTQPATNVAEWFLEHGEHTSELREWADFNAAAQRAADLDLGDFIERALEAQLTPEELAGAFQRRFYELLIDKHTAARPQLSRFRGSSHAKLIQRFRSLDVGMIDNSSKDIRARLSREKPRGSWMSAASAETSILRNEYNKRRRLKPLRKLFEEIPGLIQTLKPCLMMSPLTVCQLLDPALHTFDLAVFDEASQIPPEYAVSAFLRAKQVVVAGDRQQLPPMNFFQTMDGEEPLEDEESEDGEFESILALCDSRGFPNKMLNWHYRSRDESLIAYSNRNFYDNRLQTFPNSSLNNPSTGLKFVYVEDGIYEPGEGARHNLREARRVAELALEHKASWPGLSMGIVAFSAPQRRAIEAAMDRLRLRGGGRGGLFEADAAEPLFIKNLENVQGDERDVIILSVGYGRDEAGRLALNFGPLNRDGGARRLNVAVTRARHVLYLVTSMQPEDIDLSRASSQGAVLLREYLTTARDGIRTFTPEEEQDPTWAEESLFEEAVFEELSKRGLHLARRVGTSQYRVDLAVMDPKDSGRFLLGLECDGQMYRSGLTARDRDRLRHQVLEGLGWHMHRIWSRDWIQDREGEVQKILELVERVQNPAKRPEALPSPSKPAPRQLGWAVMHDAQVSKRKSGLSTSTQRKSTPEQRQPHSRGRGAFFDATKSQLIDELQQLANAEGPVAIRVAVRSVARAWAVRLDAEVGDRIQAALNTGAGQGAFKINAGFLWPMGLHEAPLRVHEDGQARRNLQDISPEEIASAMRACVKGALTIGRDDLLRETARLFGLRSTPANAVLLEPVLEALLEKGILEQSNHKIGRGPEFAASR